nr:hypothetical protein [Tanacetum cinerariifolium]
MQKIINEQVKEQVKVQVSKILPTIEQTVNEQLEAEVLTRGIQTTQEIEDLLVTLTPVNPDGQQQSSFVSSQFVTSMLNPTPDAGMKSIFETTSQIDAHTPTSVAPLLMSTPTLTSSTISTITTTQQAPLPPTTAPSTLLQDLPNFGSLFGFDNRLKTLKANFFEFMQMNQFAGAVSAIPGIVQRYMDQRMNEAVKIIKEQVKEQVKVQVSKILPTIEQTVNEQLEAEVLTRSSNSSRTSYAVVADLSEMELKKILIEKMEGNKSIHRSNEQRNLYKALVESYESDKIILDTYEETVTLKRHRDDDADKDEEPSVGSDRGSKRPREGKEPVSASAPTETATRSAGKSTQGTKSRQTSASESTAIEEPMQATFEMEEPAHPKFKTGADDQPITTFEMEEPAHPEFKTGADDQPIVESSQHLECIQPWISELAKQSNSHSSFNELMDTPVDFSNFLMNRLGVDTLTPELLAGPTYELLKGSYKSLVELECHLEEVYKATTDQLDWLTPKSDRLCDEAQRDNDEFLNTVDENMQKIIKEQVLGEPYSLDILSRRFYLKLILSDHSEEEEETSEEEEGSFDPIPRTPEDSEKESDDEEEQESRLSEEARIQEEEDAEELYRDVNINQGRGLQVTQNVEDTHVILTPVNPDDPQESSSMSSFVSSMLNALSDVGVESIFTTTSSKIVSLVPPTPIMTPSTIATITTSGEAPIPPPTIPSIILENLPTFNSAFRFEERLRLLETSFSEYRQTNQFSDAVSAIPGIVHQYMDQQMKEAVRETMNSVGSTKPLENLGISRMKITYHTTRITIQKRSLHIHLVDPYECDKLILDTYGDSVTLKRRRNDVDKDEEPFARSDRGSKRRRKGKDPESASAPKEKVSKTTGKSNEGSKSHQKTASESAPTDEPMQTTQDLEELSHQEFETSTADDQPIAKASQHPEWFQKQTKPLTTDRAWKKTLPVVHRSIQPWISDLAKQADSRGSFNELMDTPIDFSSFLMNRLNFYGFTINRESARDVYSKRRIIAVIELQIVEWHDYNYQKKLNLTKPDTYKTDLKRKEAYTTYSNPRGFIYQNKDKQNILMRIDELHKFSDGTLDDVLTALDDRLKGIQIKYPPQTIWRKSNKERAAAMIQAIDRQLKTRRIMQSLENFVGGRLYEGDFRMLQRTI